MAAHHTQVRLLAAEPYSTAGPVRHLAAEPYSTDEPAPLLAAEPYSTAEPVRHLAVEPYSTDGPAPLLAAEPYSTAGPVRLFATEHNSTAGPAPLLAAEPYMQYRRTSAPPRCRTLQYRMTRMPQFLPLWNEFRDVVFDGAGPAGVKSRVNASLLTSALFVSFYSLF